MARAVAALEMAEKRAPGKRQSSCAQAAARERVGAAVPPGHGRRAPERPARRHLAGARAEWVAVVQAPGGALDGLHVVHHGGESPRHAAASADLRVPSLVRHDVFADLVDLARDLRTDAAVVEQRLAFLAMRGRA
jgi:hypothetical protein